jgi:flagellar M-ring protein FliF
MLEFLKKLKDKFIELSNPFKIGLIFGVALFISVIIYFTFSSSKSYAPLFYNISAAQSGSVIEFLKKERIPFKINDTSGLIEVPKEEVYQIRMELAKSGFPGNAHIGWEIFDKTKLGETEFVQRIDYLRALQGELGRSIETISGIKSARVHIVIPKDSLFLEDETPATASIIITYDMGYTKLKKNQIKGIVNLVANSVEGLKPENVKVIDSRGNVLTDILKEDEDDYTEGIDKKLTYKKKLEKYFAKRIQNMLEKVVGKGKAIATVTTDIDFTKSEKTMEFYDPENVAERSHEKSNEISNEYNPQKGGVPGVVSNVPSVMAQQQGQAGKSQNIKKTFNKNREIVNYEISKTVSKIIDPVGVIKRISVAVVVDGKYKLVKKGKKEVREFVPRTKDEMLTLKEIVKKAIGFDPKRNDQVEVSCIPFNYEQLKEIKIGQYQKV